MTWQQWTVAIMLAGAFVDRVCIIFNGRRYVSIMHVIALVVAMGLTGAFIAVLHSGGFW